MQAKHNCERQSGVIAACRLLCGMRFAQRPALCASAKALLLVTVLLSIAVLTGFLLTDHKIQSSATGQHLRAKVQIKTNIHLPEALHRPAGDSTGQAIPNVLHHVYLDGLDSLRQAESTAGPQPGARFPGYNRTLRRSCPQVHLDWQYMFWNISQAEELVKTVYPWFLGTFLSYQTNVQRGGACYDARCGFASAKH